MTDISPTQKSVLKEVVGKEAVSKKGREEENVIYTSFLETEYYILEQVSSSELSERYDLPSGLGFVIFDKRSGTSTVEKEFFYNNLYHRPIVDDLVTTKAISLPTGVEEYGTTAELVEEIRKFLTDYFELPSFYSSFIPYLIMFYWVYERFPFIPYLQFVGRTGTGKSTAMEVIGSICYKSIDASGAITLSSIFRTASTWHGTLLLDEFGAGGENYHEMISFLKSGVSNKVVLRVEGDKERKVRAYVIKSPKLFTSEDPISDAGLQSRTIVIRMEKNTRKIPLYRLKLYDKQAEILRNKLLLWRLRNLGKIDLNQIEYGFPELEIFDRRVQQVITPIFYFSDEQSRVNIIEFAKEQQRETVRERAESLSGQIFQAIADVYPTPLSLSAITADINKSRANKTEYSPKKVGSVIRKVLGLDTIRSRDGYFVVIDGAERKIKELSNYFGIGIPEERSSSTSSSQTSHELEEEPYQVSMDDVPGEDD